MTEPKRPAFPLWILAVAVPGFGALLLCCVGGIGFVAYRWSSPVPAAPLQNAPVAEAKKENPAPADEPKGDARQPEQKPDLMVIFQHTPGKSVAKLVKRGSPIPPGWQGGAGRLLSIQIGQAEGQLSATLADGKEGQTATLTSLR